MRKFLLASAALILLLAPAGAEVPLDLWGYFPGQAQDAALTIDSSRTVQRCTEYVDMGRARNRECLKWTQDYLDHSADVQVMFVDDKVERVLISIFNTKQKNPSGCRELAVDVVNAAIRLYGPYTQHGNGWYRWSNGQLKLNLQGICGQIAPSKEAIGGISGTFEPDTPAN